MTPEQRPTKIMSQITTPEGQQDYYRDLAEYEAYEERMGAG